MNRTARYGRFLVVGAMGMVLQLTVLALLHRWNPHHLLLASAAALELTLMHNFLWHIRYTWQDRGHGSSRLRQCLRFHLANGGVSMIGNLAMMRVLVHTAHLPVVVANLIAILSCSAATFCLGNRWAFRETLPPQKGALPCRSPRPPSPLPSRPRLRWMLQETD